MKRKLKKQGIGGLTFYIPKKWIVKKGLEPGDDINIQEIQDKLVLSSEKIKKKNQIEITLENQSKEFIRNYLNQLYDRIKKFEEENLNARLRNFMGELELELE